MAFDRRDVGGAGQVGATASNTGCTPIPSSAEPQSTGTIMLCSVASRSVLRIRASGGVASASSNSVSSSLYNES